ncbi:hypothetical protein KQX54_015391 [Cotesia glomerata]|uniref:Uncharacterized protein n=1 Tax=Cotesia glomerata TaxID=32391 RepID=A0AAV7IX24_COTGL|nr:hypothetical protein KQX54_015391 [Cotesia glomerata]
MEKESGISVNSSTNGSRAGKKRDYNTKDACREEDLYSPERISVIGYSIPAFILSCGGAPDIPVFLLPSEYNLLVGLYFRLLMLLVAGASAAAKNQESLDLIRSRPFICTERNIKRRNPAANLRVLDVVVVSLFPRYHNGEPTSSPR